MVEKIQPKENQLISKQIFSQMQTKEPQDATTTKLQQWFSYEEQPVPPQEEGQHHVPKIVPYHSMQIEEEKEDLTKQKITEKLPMQQQVVEGEYCFEFEVDKVELSKQPMNQISQEDMMNRIYGNPKVESSSMLQNKQERFAQIFRNGSLIDAITTAYMQHFPVAFAADHIWLKIVQGIAVHITENAESLRSVFVDFEGKQELVVIRDFFKLGNAMNDWKGVFEEFNQKITAFIGKDNKDQMIEVFSTTSKDSFAVQNLTLMCGMQKYFDYRVLTRCGIPKVKLLGKSEDWNKLNQKVTELIKWDAKNKIGLGKWLNEVQKITAEFSKAANKQPDVNFWQNMYKKRQMSGGEKITGWIFKLYPKLFEENYISSSDIPLGVQKFPFIWEYLGKEIKMSFSGGFIGVNQDQKTLELTPNIGWTVLHNSTENKKKKIKSQSSIEINRSRGRRRVYKPK